MAGKLGTLTLDLIAKIGGFTGPLDQSAKKTEQWGEKVSIAAIAAGTAIGGFAADAVRGLAAFVAESVNAGAEFQALSTIAGIASSEFQKLAFGARSVGVENEQLADILKDVNDRVGDFLTTGGGPMADFFEKVAPKVGVTAEQFRNLSGPQALGLFVDTLEKAGANSQDFTFFMEAMASDSTKLVPLLRNGGAGMQEMAAQAESLGLILSDETTAAAEEFSDGLALAGQIVTGVGQKVAVELLPYLSQLTDALTDPRTAEAAAAMARGIAVSFTAIINSARETVGFIKWASESAAAFMGGIAADDVVRLNGEIERLQAMKASGALDRIVLFGRDGLVSYYNDDELDSELARMIAARDAAMNRASVPPPLPAPEVDSQPGSGLHIDLSADSAKKASDSAAKAAQKAADAIISQVAALRLQADMVGMSADEQTLYRLALDGATESQLAQAKAALDSVAAFEAQTEAKQKAAEEQARINEEAQGIADSLLSEEDQILASYERRRQIILDNTKITGEAQAELLRKLEEKKNEDLLEINGSYWERYLEAAEESLQSFDELAGSVIENFSSQFGGAFEAMVFDAQSLEEAVSGMAEGMARSVVNALGQMAAQWLAYQLVQMLVGTSAQSSGAIAMVANAQATAGQAALAAFASTAAIPVVGPELAPAAAAAATAATMPMVAAISTAAMSGLAGMAHDGIDSVPQTGTWLLEKGERVTTAETSAKLDRTLSDIQSSRAAPGGGRPIQINNSFPNVTNAREARQSAAGASRSLARAVQSAGRYT